MSGSSRRNRNNDESTPGAPLWMTTYGDLITLILVFFVLLYSLSNIDNQKFELAMLSLQGSLGIIEGGKTLSPGDFVEADEVGLLLVSSEEQREFEDLFEEIESIVQEEDLSGVMVNLDERGLTISFVEGVLFDSGKADLKTQAEKALDSIVPTLKKTLRHIRVEGHTDNLPIRTLQFPSNWELSTARAVNVIKYFIEQHNFSPYILSAAGYSEYRPIAPNDTDQRRALNRRVDIVILKSSSQGEEPK